MAGSSNFLVFDENNQNIQDDSTYTANTARQNGVSAGMASSQLHNKLYRQATIMAAALGQWMANQDQVVSDADLAELVNVITNSIAKQSDLMLHKADTMPHKFTDGTTTYRWGLAVIDGVVNMVYEEVV